MTFDNLLGYILLISMRMQKFIKIFQTVIDIFHEQAGTKSSQTGRGQNLHKLSDDKIKCLIIGHSMKFNFQFHLTFGESCNFNTMRNFFYDKYFWSYLPLNPPSIKLAHGSRFMVHGSRFAVHGSRFAVHGSRFTVHSSRFVVYDLQFTVHDSQFTVHDSQFTIHGS